jgi:hypothetical protein
MMLRLLVVECHGEDAIVKAEGSFLKGLRATKEQGLIFRRLFG